jgi:1-acyl-sn-glycerol-3-phosphate acyltransferase
LCGALYGACALLSFSLIAILVLLVNLVLVRPRSRRRVAAASSRLFLHIMRVPFSVDGRARLPDSPCVVVANHSSYLDGLVLAAALPPEFAFVIKKEMVAVPLASILLRRLGSEFVERHNRHQGAVDARRVLRRAADGQSMVFFPEGTFDVQRAIRPFHRGAFATAARAGLPIVAVAIHGARAALPGNSLRLRRVPLRVEILAVLAGEHARQHSRELIAAAIGEPLA